VTVVKTIHGDVGARLRVDEDLAVRGTLREGADVADGCRLLVHGNLRGTVTIGRRGLLALGGTFGAFIDRNEGTLAVAGVLATPIETIPGMLLVAPNSAVTVAGSTGHLGADGVVRHIEDVLDVGLTSGVALRWDSASEVFVPHPSDVFDRLARLVLPDPPAAPDRSPDGPPGVSD
jgi:hypothetical protein